MKFRWLALLALLVAGRSYAQPMLIPYGTAFTVPFCLYDYTTPNELEPTITFEAADVKVSQAGTEGNSSNSPTDNGNCFSLTLDSTETDVAYGNIIIDDDDNVWLPINMPFVTIGNPSAGIPWLGIPGIASGTTAAAANGASNARITTSLDGEAFNNAILYLLTCTGGPGARLVTGTTDNGATVDLTVNSAYDADPDSCPFYVLPTNQTFLSVSATGVVDSNTVSLFDSSNLLTDDSGANEVTFFDNNSTISTTNLDSLDPLTTLADIDTVIYRGTATAGGDINTCVDTNLTAFDEDQDLDGNLVVFENGQRALIDSYNAATTTFELTADITAVCDGQDYEIYPALQ